MAPEPYRRCHLIQAALMGLGVPRENIDAFVVRFVSMAASPDATDQWNLALDEHELDLLIRLLSDEDSHLCEATLEGYFQFISEHSSLSEEELWDFACHA